MKRSQWLLPLGIAAFAMAPPATALAQTFDLTALDDVQPSSVQNHLIAYSSAVGQALDRSCSGALIGPDLFLTAEHCDDSFDVDETIRFQDWPGALTWVPTSGFPFMVPHVEPFDATVTEVVASVAGGWPGTGIDAKVLRLGVVRYSSTGNDVQDGASNDMLPGELLGYLRIRGWKQSLDVDVCMSGTFPGAGELMSTCGEIAGGDWTWVDCDYGDACRHSTMHSIGGMSGAAWINDDGFVIGINRGRYESQPGGDPTCWWDDDVSNECYATGTNAHNAMRRIGAMQDMIAVDSPQVESLAVPVFLSAPFRHWIFYPEDETGNTLMMGRKHTSVSSGATLNYPFLQRDATLLGSQLPRMGIVSRGASWKNDDPELGHAVYVSDDARLIHAYGGSSASWTYEDLTHHLGANQTPLDVAGWRSSNGIQHIGVAVSNGGAHAFVHLYYDNQWAVEQVAAITPYAIGSLTAWQSTGSGGGPVQHLAWFETDGDLMHLYHSNGNWTGPVLVTANTNTAAWRHNSLTAVNSSGNQHLVYVDQNDHINVVTWLSNPGVWDRRDVTALSGGLSVKAFVGDYSFRLTAWSAQKPDRTLSIAFMNTSRNVGMIYYDPQANTWRYRYIALGSTKTLPDGSFYDERPRTMLLGSRYDNLGYVGVNGHVYYITTDTPTGYVNGQPVYGDVGANVPIRDTAGKRWLRYDLSARTGMPAPWEYDPLIGQTYP